LFYFYPLYDVFGYFFINLPSLSSSIQLSSTVVDVTRLLIAVERRREKDREQTTTFNCLLMRCLLVCLCFMQSISRSPSHAPTLPPSPQTMTLHRSRLLQVPLRQSLRQLTPIRSPQSAIRDAVEAKTAKRRIRDRNKAKQRKQSTYLLFLQFNAADYGWLSAHSMFIAEIYPLFAMCLIQLSPNAIKIAQN